MWPASAHNLRRGSVQAPHPLPVHPCMGPHSSSLWETHRHYLQCTYGVRVQNSYQERGTQAKPQVSLIVQQNVANVLTKRLHRSSSRARGTRQRRLARFLACTRRAVVRGTSYNTLPASTRITHIVAGDRSSWAVLARDISGCVPLRPITFFLGKSPRPSHSLQPPPERRTPPLRMGGDSVLPACF